jgi:hypothetical protein
MGNGQRDGSAIVMGNCGGDGQRQVSQRETATAAARSQWASMVVVQWMAGRQQQRNCNHHEWWRQQWGMAMVVAR